MTVKSRPVSPLVSTSQPTTRMTVTSSAGPGTSALPLPPLTRARGSGWPRASWRCCCCTSRSSRRISRASRRASRSSSRWYSSSSACCLASSCCCSTSAWLGTGVLSSSTSAASTTSSRSSLQEAQGCQACWVGTQFWGPGWLASSSGNKAQTLQHHAAASRQQLPAQGRAHMRCMQPWYPHQMHCMPSWVYRLGSAE